MSAPSTDPILAERSAPELDTTEAVGPWRKWSRHLLCFYIPFQATLFLVTGPHRGYLTPLFLIPLILAFVWDRNSPPERAQPQTPVPALRYDLLVYALAGVQVLNIALLARLFAVQSWLSLDMLFSILIVGGASGFSIITAHELIHRKKGWERQLGRLLLCTVMYEHFYTEHIRGHHVRVGRGDDPATARFGESFQRFFVRTVPAQFKSAWRLETRRLGDADMRLLDARQLGNRVLHGLVAEWGLALAILAICGATAFVAFLIQAVFAFRLLEIVNYFEHWGLQRANPRRVQPSDSWDTHSRFTYYALVGLSRHADHHAYASRPYQELRVWEEPPILPRGYVAMIPLVLARNRKFQLLASEELQRKKLGPFRETASGEARASEAAG